MQNRPTDGTKPPLLNLLPASHAAQASLLQALGLATPGQIAYFSAPDLRCLFANQRYAQPAATRCSPHPGAAFARHCCRLAPGKPHSTQVQAYLAGQAQHYTCTAEGLRGDTRHLEVHLVPHCEQPTAANTPASGVAGSVVGLGGPDTGHHAPLGCLENAAKDHAQRLRKFNDASQELIIFTKAA